MSSDAINMAVTLIISDFELDEEKIPLVVSDDKLGRVRDILISEIANLIEHNMERLKWILYRIDVSEQKLQAALAENAPADAPVIIADMIIERQIQKAETRLKFKSREKGDWD